MFKCRGADIKVQSAACFWPLFPTPVEIEKDGEKDDDTNDANDASIKAKWLISLLAQMRTHDDVLEGMQWLPLQYLAP